MIDPFLSQTWADHHGAFTDFIADLVRQTLAAFERLVARAYDAPWSREDSKERRSELKRSVQR